jgi:hypothetical protein
MKIKKGNELDFFFENIDDVFDENQVFCSSFLKI